MISSREKISHDERIKRLNLTGLKRRRIRDDLTEFFKIIKGVDGRRWLSGA